MCINHSIEMCLRFAACSYRPRALVKCSAWSNLWSSSNSSAARCLPPPMSLSAVKETQTWTSMRSGTFQLHNRFCHSGNFDKLLIFVVTSVCIFSQQFVTAATETDVCATAVMKKSHTGMQIVYIWLDSVYQLQFREFYFFKYRLYISKMFKMFFEPWIINVILLKTIE